MENIKIEKAIVHILDTDINMPVLSDELLALDNTVQEFLIRHIDKSLEDAEMKPGRFQGENNEMEALIKNSLEGDFIGMSQNIAQRIFNMAYSNVAIPAADLLVCIVQCDEKSYLGILKFNYKESYIHFYSSDGERKMIHILQQKTTLPNAKQKLEEFAFVDLKNYAVLIKEKKYEINGAKEFYLSTNVFRVSSELSPKEKYTIVEKSAQKVVKEYYNGDVQKLSQIKNAIKTSIQEEGHINIDRVSEEVFLRDSSSKQLYQEEVEKKGVVDKCVNVPNTLEKKINKKQKLSTDSGIEISFPTEYLDNAQKIEFLQNPDGSMSILIKSINELKSN